MVGMSFHLKGTFSSKFCSYYSCVSPVGMKNCQCGMASLPDFLLLIGLLFLSINAVSFLFAEVPIPCVDTALHLLFGISRVSLCLGLPGLRVSLLFITEGAVSGSSSSELLELLSLSVFSSSPLQATRSHGILVA